MFGDDFLNPLYFLFILKSSFDSLKPIRKLKFFTFFFLLLQRSTAVSAADSWGEASFSLCVCLQ